MDTTEGVLVARSTAAVRYTSEMVAEVVASERRFLAAPDIPGRPKVRLILSDPGAPPPGPNEREQFSKLLVDRRIPRLHAYVSDSVVTRAAFAVISVLRGVTFAPQERAFATREAAIDWFESRRPGVRAPLVALVEKVDAQILREQGARRAA